MSHFTQTLGECLPMPDQSPPQTGDATQISTAQPEPDNLILEVVNGDKENFAH